MKKNELFERIKKRGIESVRFDMENNNTRIEGKKSVIKRYERELKEIPKLIEQDKLEIKLLEGQIELMRSSITEIEGFKLLEEEK